MLRTLIPLVVAVAVARLNGNAITCGGERPSEKSAPVTATSKRIAPEAIRRHVEFLASPRLEGRGTARGKLLAAAYICRQFEELRLEPLFGTSGYTQDIPAPKSDDGEPAIMGRNLGAYLPGSDPKLKDEVVIVSAHYDHLGIRGGKIYPGADDNAGSVAMMLEVARRLAASPAKPRRTIVFLSCDLEENLLFRGRFHE
jgi:hypothetical protein